MKSILLAGSGSFLGKNIIDYYQNNQDNYKLIPVRRSDVDFADTKAFNKYIESVRPDYIIHSAASLDNFENNLRMYYSLEKVADKCKKIIILGSGAEYGSNRYKPLMKEEYFQKIVQNSIMLQMKMVIDK